MLRKTLLAGIAAIGVSACAQPGPVTESAADFQSRCNTYAQRMSPDVYNQTQCSRTFPHPMVQEQERQERIAKRQASLDATRIELQKKLIEGMNMRLAHYNEEQPDMPTFNIRMTYSDVEQIMQQEFSNCRNSSEPSQPTCHEIQGWMVTQAKRWLTERLAGIK